MSLLGRPAEAAFERRFDFPQRDYDTASALERLLDELDGEDPATAGEDL